MLHILAREEPGWPPPEPRLTNFHHYQNNVFMDWEPPEHTRIRSLVSKVFTPRQVESLRAKLKAATHKLLDMAEGNRTCNFVSQIGGPLPVMMIADLLGIPEAGRPYLRPWSAAIVKIYELGYSEEQMQAADTAAREFMDSVGALAEERRAHPQDDLISGLVHVEDHGRKLSDEIPLERLIPFCRSIRKCIRRINELHTGRSCWRNHLPCQEWKFGAWLQLAIGKDD